MIYEDIYQHQGSRIKDYNSEVVTFLHKYDYGIGYVFLGIFVAIIGIFVVVGGASGISNVLKDRSFWHG